MSREQQAFEQALKERLRDRASLILRTDQAVQRDLRTAAAQILQALAGQPPDWRQWRLAQLLAQLSAVLDGATGRAATVVDGALRDAWSAGEDFIDKPLGVALVAGGGQSVEPLLPLLDVQVLTQLRRFTALRLKDVGSDAATRIGRQLSLVTIGARTPFEAIRDVQRNLGNDTPQRATTIVRTEVGRAFAIASQQRLEQSAALVPGLKKQWRRSGKIHSRWGHDSADGQVQDVAKPFVIPSNDGPQELMHPHDPKAPVAEVINCGCIALPWRKEWADGADLATPGAKPFSQRELQLDGRKARLDLLAKKAGLRPQSISNSLKTHLKRF